MTFRELDKIARKNGWYEVEQVGSHHHYKHPNKKGKLTIPEHANKDLKIKTAKNILKFIGIEE